MSIALESGDAFVFGGPSRLAVSRSLTDHARHGASRTRPPGPIQSDAPPIRRSMPRVVVIGAGAAGTMAAIFAASAGADTVLVERTNDGGRKILISGGGRCNILPAQLDESRFITDSSAHMVRRIVRSWPLREQTGVLRARPGASARRGVRVGQAVPEIAKRARRARPAARPRAPQRRERHHRHRSSPAVEPSAGRWIVARHDGQPLRRRCGRSRHRRAVGAEDRQRWSRAGHGRAARTRDESDVPRADATPRQTRCGPFCGAVGAIAACRDHGAKRDA